MPSAGKGFPFPVDTVPAAAECSSAPSAQDPAGEVAMLKCHKKLHRMAKARLDGSKPRCCTPVFVNHPEWGQPPSPGPGLPMRWIIGARARGGGQR